jgi:hypothetical protein
MTHPSAVLHQHTNEYYATTNSILSLIQIACHLKFEYLMEMRMGRLKRMMTNKKV